MTNLQVFLVSKLVYDNRILGIRVLLCNYRRFWYADFDYDIVSRLSLYNRLDFLKGEELYEAGGTLVTQNELEGKLTVSDSSEDYDLSIIVANIIKEDYAKTLTKPYGDLYVYTYKNVEESEVWGEDVIYEVLVRNEEDKDLKKHTFNLLLANRNLDSNNIILIGSKKINKT